MVSCFDCDKSSPLCLYDFTLKNVLLDQQVLRVPNLAKSLDWGYFDRDQPPQTNNEPQD